MFLQLLERVEHERVDRRRLLAGEPLAVEPEGSSKHQDEPLVVVHLFNGATLQHHVGREGRSAPLGEPLGLGLDGVERWRADLLGNVVLQLDGELADTLAGDTEHGAHLVEGCRRSTHCQDPVEQHVVSDVEGQEQLRRGSPRVVVHDSGRVSERRKVGVREHLQRPDGNAGVVTGNGSGERVQHRPLNPVGRCPGRKVDQCVDHADGQRVLANLVQLGLDRRYEEGLRRNQLLGEPEDLVQSARTDVRDQHHLGRLHLRQDPPAQPVVRVQVAVEGPADLVGGRNRLEQLHPGHELAKQDSLSVADPDLEVDVAVHRAPPCPKPGLNPGLGRGAAKFHFPPAGRCPRGCTAGRST